MTAWGEQDGSGDAPHVDMDDSQAPDSYLAIEDGTLSDDAESVTTTQPEPTPDVMTDESKPLSPRRLLSSFEGVAKMDDEAEEGELEAAKASPHQSMDASQTLIPDDSQLDPDDPFDSHNSEFMGLEPDVPSAPAPVNTEKSDGIKGDAAMPPPPLSPGKIQRRNEIRQRMEELRWDKNRNKTSR